MIFRELSNAAFRFSLRRPGAEIMGGVQTPPPPPPPAGGGKSRGPAGRGLMVADNVDNYDPCLYFRAGDAFFCFEFRDAEPCNLGRLRLRLRATISAPAPAPSKMSRRLRLRAKLPAPAPAPAPAPYIKNAINPYLSKCSLALYDD